MSPLRTLVYSAMSVRWSTPHDHTIVNASPVCRTTPPPYCSTTTTYSLAGVYNLRDYFPSFCQLNTLALKNIEIEPTITEHLEIIFSTFQHTLSLLTLTNFTITWSAFVALVGYFPRLQHLEIRNPSILVDDSPVPELPHALHGRLAIDMWGEGAKPFVDLFLGLKQEYEELEMAPDYEPRLVSAAKSSLKSLKIEKWKRASL